MAQNETDRKQAHDPERRDSRDGVDKNPFQEKGKKDKLTTEDLKAKKVDADPSQEPGKPTH